MGAKELIQTITVGAGGAASIDFNSIPQTGTDLYIIFSGRASTASSATELLFNSSTTNFSYRMAEGSGSAASSGNGAVAAFGGLTGSGQTASTFGNFHIYIPNYTSAAYKSFTIDCVTENNATAAYQNIVTGLWSNTAAITSISLRNYSAFGGTLNQYSTASLYKITKGSGGATVA